jgi:hypothetical protein
MQQDDKSPGHLQSSAPGLKDLDPLRRPWMSFSHGCTAWWSKKPGGSRRSRSTPCWFFKW